ncbi:MAG: sugar phosphate isomerase/epimerase [Gemmatimonadetes bacterium]|jgi:3-oxoisoapionate decarboxylase|nr:sugar phosphate isomerase/epimerase [Gemmatimonadota bacterium]
MKLGIGTYAYAWAIGTVTGQRPGVPMDAGKFLRRCAGLGVELVQIADNLPLHLLADEELGRVEGEAEELGLAVEVGTRGIGPNLLRDYLEICRKFESPVLRTVIDTADFQPSVGEVVEILRGMKREFEEAGVTLALENHDRFSVRTFAEILERVDSSHLGICLDTANSFGALEGPEVVVEALGPHVVNLHIKDFAVRRIDHSLGFVVEGTAAGQGQLDIPWLLERLGKLAKGDFNAILELWPPPEEDVEATVRKEEAWVAASVDYLRSLIPE